ncbi:hypothetical protein [Pseudooceanicola sp.]|uniref:hypothetical protein n=1 Tax=Pseudooceanicola sp. TaxID=1914328 RepID=UPI0040587FA3
MAASVIGALRVNLGLDSAKFESGTKRASKSLQAMRTQFAAVAGAAAALGGAIAAAALKGGQEIDRAAKAARRLDASIGGFRALELAASEAGVPLSGLTNDVQNMAREIANIGTSGNAERALDKLGIAASELAGLDADEKVALIADRVNGLGLSAGEATAVLRDLGVRNREMALLMIQGGAAIRAARKDVDEYGLALDSVDAAKIEQANDRLGRLSLITQYAGQQLAVALVPAFGRLAQVMTDSLREGGLLRTVLDGLVGSLDRLAAYVGVAVAAFGVRYVGALVAARLATFSLAGAMAFLRAAIIRTGIGALIVGAGELVLWFGRLVTATGGWSEALSLLGEVAAGVWEGIVGAAKAIPPGLAAIWKSVASGFYLLVSDLANMWSSFLQSVASTIEGIPVFSSTFDQLQNGVTSVIRLSGDYADKASRAAQASEHLSAAAGRLATEGFDKAKTALGKLRSSLDDIDEDAGSTTESVEAMNNALAATDGAAGGGKGGGGVKGAKDKLTELEKAAKSASDQIRGSFTDAFKGVLTGAQSMGEAVSGVLSKLADMLLTSVGNSLFGGIANSLGGIFGSIPAFATGTNYAPGGLAWVGERGPELVDLPRGSRVIPNHNLPAAQGGKLEVILGEGLEARWLNRAAGQSAKITQRAVGAQQSSLMGRVQSMEERGTTR